MGTCTAARPAIKPEKRPALRPAFVLFCLITETKFVSLAIPKGVGVTVGVNSVAPPPPRYTQEVRGVEGAPLTSTRQHSPFFCRGVSS